MRSTFFGGILDGAEKEVIGRPDRYLVPLPCYSLGIEDGELPTTMPRIPAEEYRLCGLDDFGRLQYRFVGRNDR